MQRNIERLHTALLAGFIIVALTLGYWQFFRQEEVLARSTNPRLAEEAQRVVRGKILDRNGVVLAESRVTPEGVSRVYTRPGFAAVTGYHSLRYGNANVEARYNDYLRGAQSADPIRAFLDQLLHRPTVGTDVVLTIDARVQQAAVEALGGARGAIVALDPKTGVILALASSPTYDPNRLEAVWEELVADEAGRPLFNRAIQSAYTPGSTFKLVTAAAAVDLGLVDPNAEFRCTRPIVVDGLSMDCRNHAHVPVLDFREAFAWSSNRTFGLVGLELGLGRLQLGDDLEPPYPWEGPGIAGSAGRLEEYAERFQFGREIPFDLPVAVGQLKNRGDWYPSLLAQTAFGQGELEATPLQMALVAATVANGGVMPAPSLALEARAPSGAVTDLSAGGSLGRVIKPETAALLNEMMVLSVEIAYAQKAKIPGVKVGGKTGTAETGPAGATPHSWFIGYAPADDPRVAVAAIFEHRGSGSDFAAPAAQQVMRAALEAYRPEGR
ncbi:MAG: penicillin-binding protein 2 [Chloroflexota bacterium]|nr:penicillin-binding protein 2 [Chloroflexota bacterium]